MDKERMDQIVAAVNVINAQGRGDLMELFLSGPNPPRNVVVYVHPAAYAILEKRRAIRRLLENADRRTLIINARQFGHNDAMVEVLNLFANEPTQPPTIPKPNRHKWKPRRYFNG